jgi:uncharacterized damage-inducible protein DinB
MQERRPGGRETASKARADFKEDYPEKETHMPDELQSFLNLWDREAEKTASLLRSLPASQYDFRPDPGGRSLGELAWHLAEVDSFIPFCIEQGVFSFTNRPPGIERPKTVEALAPGYERLHAEGAGRIRSKLTAADLDRKLRFFTGDDMAIRDILWSAVLLHAIHHRGQLSLMCRMAGGTAPGVFGPNREEMAKFRARA